MSGDHLRYSRQHEAAERVALRRWLVRHAMTPCANGQTPSDLQRLMLQVREVSDMETVSRLMFEARAKVDRLRESGA